MNTTELQRCIVSQNSQHHNFTHRFCTHFFLFWSYNIIFIILHEKTFQKMYGLLYTYPYSFRVIKLQSSLAGIVAFFPKPVRCKRDVQADNPAITENACICQACHTRARRRPAPLESKPDVTQPAKEKTASCGIEYCMEALVRGTNMKSIFNITTGRPSSIMVIHVICSLSTAPRLHVCESIRITTTM